MFKKILFAFDGSDNSLKAADYAIKLAQLDKAEVELIFVRATANFYPATTIYPNLEDLEHKFEEAAEKIIAIGVEKFKNNAVEVTPKILQGDPADAICNEAEKNNFDLIVIGSRGANPATRFLLGSVANKVINHSKVSVFIVK